MSRQSSTRRFTINRNKRMDKEIEASFRYFENRKCQYYPCHKSDNINCLFCFCPLYRDKDCGGKYKMMNGIKDCSDCLVPHCEENYGLIIDKLRKKEK